MKTYKIIIPIILKKILRKTQYVKNQNQKQLKQLAIPKHIYTLDLNENGMWNKVLISGAINILCR